MEEYWQNSAMDTLRIHLGSVRKQILPQKIFGHQRRKLR